MNFTDMIHIGNKYDGEINNTKFGEYFNLHESSVRGLKKRDSKKFEALYLGALCQINNLTKEDLEKIFNEKKSSK